MTIKRGNRGDDVVQAQQALADLGFEIDVDGIFGRGTEAVVKAFQRQQGLAVDGIVGANTLAALGVGGAPRPPVGTAQDWAAFKQEIVQIAQSEWEFWHDANGNKKVETDAAMIPRLQTYYDEGVKRRVKSADLANPTFQEKHPWSAVFISWIMRKAQADSYFRYASAHWRYVNAAKQSRLNASLDNPFWAYRINEVKPGVGDIVCNGRSKSNATYDNIGDGKKTHCDIVVAVRPNELIVIGGNVGNTVGKKRVQLDADGFVLRAGKQSSYFAVIRIRPKLDEPDLAPANP